jgi:hypothetical protein
MKRANREGIGRLLRLSDRRDVAGIAPRPQLHDVASYRFALEEAAVREGAQLASEESQLQADFAEFLSGGEVSDGLPGPDPVFRERLRRQLWRQHVMTHLRDAGETH